MNRLVVHPLIGVAPRQDQKIVRLDRDGRFGRHRSEAGTGSDGGLGHWRNGIMNEEFRMKRVLSAALLLLLNSSFEIRNSSFASDFLPALPGYEFEFPRDHGTHDEYRTEWWYYTGHLQGASGR